MAYQMDAHHAPVDPSVPLEYSTEDGQLKILGFWVFIAADIVLFSCLFATYVVLHNNTYGGPTAEQLFDVPGFVTETLLLLTSSFTCGLAIFEMHRSRLQPMIGWWIVTILLGMGFVGMEISEFAKYVGEGANITRSAFLSSFFILVGTHGTHVTIGIFWMISILIQLIRYGITAVTARKAFVVSIYWHFLDAIWIFIFTVVYLSGKVS